MKVAIFAVLFLTSCTAATTKTDYSSLQQAINGNHRSEQHKNRDQYRHPLKTLTFFDVQPDMTVVEIWPGNTGWYTEILAPYLKDRGRFYTAQFSDNSSVPYFRKSLKVFTDKLNIQPDIYGNTVITTLQAPKEINIAPKGTADRVLTFRNVHNWMKSGQAETVFKAMYDALKVGGILGVVEHRAKADSVQDPKARSGYVTERYVINLAEKVGFQLLAKTEINANPKDSTNHPKGVWTLPPSLRLKNLNKEKYIAIGESDRMTLKFTKK